jgi:hypothetical protein
VSESAPPLDETPPQQLPEPARADHREKTPAGRPDHRSHGTPDPVAPTNPDAPKAKPPREPVRSAEEPRPLTIDGEEWLAYPSGKGSYGTGHWGLAGVEAVHFAKAGEPPKPEFEALLASGRFADLYDEELIALFRTARAIVIPEPGTVPAPRRFSLEEDRS